MMIFITILQLIAALILILVVLFQSGKSQGLSGAIGGRSRDMCSSLWRSCWR